MKSVAAVSLLAASTLALAAPSAKRAAITDTDILNYALTLEHLEANFYAGALSKYDNASFAAVNVDRSRFEQIAAHETQHVAFLTGALGKDATGACNYSFPYTDVASFIGLAAVLENVGVSAYLGAAPLITNPAYLTAAASILTTESRHQAYVSYVSGGAPWSGAYDTPLSLDDIYSLAAPFITSCPTSNPTLPVKAFPALNVTSTNNTAGSQLQFAYASTANNSSAPAYIAFFSGLTTQSVPINNGSNSVTIPSGLNGTVYAVVTTSANGTVTDANTLAGPAILSLGGLTVDGGSNGTGVLNTTNSGGGNGTSGGGNGGGNGGGSGGKGGAMAVGVKGAGVIAGLMLAGFAAVLF